MATGDGFAGIPQVSGGGLPESSVRGGSTALMIIDMQYLDADRNHGLGATGRQRGTMADMEYYFSRLERLVVPNIRHLLQASRDAGIRVVHVRVMNLAGDSEDTSWRYKMFGFRTPPGSKEAEIIDELAPLPNEIVLSKTTSSVFMSTNADFVLRNLGIDTIIMTGVVTNNCVESSTRNAADLGYRVLLVDDGCAAWTQEGHDYCVRHLDHNFAIVKSTEQVLEEIAATVGVREPAGVA
jgi:nicotinamidase-related amidase